MTTYDHELEDARRMDREHPCPDASVGYEEALEITRIEAETCRCTIEDGQLVVNTECEWHGDTIWRDIDSGEFWEEGYEAKREARIAATHPIPSQPAS